MENDWHFKEIERREVLEASYVPNLLEPQEEKFSRSEIEYWGHDGHDQCWCLHKEACGRKENNGGRRHGLEVMDRQSLTSKRNKIGTSNGP